MENKQQGIGQNNLMDNFVKTDDILKDMCGIIESSQKAAYQAVNTTLVQRNWLLGYRIASEELQGEDRAKYGAEVIKKLAKELSAEYGKGYTKSNLYHFYSFYKTFPEIFQTMSGKSQRLLSWSHYAILLQVKDAKAREWYEREAFEQSWSVRTLQRNVSSQYYYRMLQTQKHEPVEKEMKELTAEYQNDKMEIRLPDKVKKIIHTLQENGHEAYAVGGCVRDSVLGRTPGDWDITTSATPEETKALFDRTFDTGIEHGTITVLLGKEGFEVTTYRIDGTYEDSRHPSGVSFTRNLKEDLLRRDFTINAMAYNDEEGLVDIFGGMEDMKRKVIRCVGNAKERFSEDALRIMRAVRFAAQLGFEIEEETKEGIRTLAPNLKHISAERIQVELIKLLVSDRPDMMRCAYELGITKEVLPEFDRMMKTEQETPHHMYTVGEHTIQAVCAVRNDKVLRLTMLLHDVAKPEMKTTDEKGVAHFKGHDRRGEAIAKEILRRLKFDNDTLRTVCRLIYYHDYRMPAKPKNVRRAMNKIGKELFPLYLEVRMADTLAQSNYMRNEKVRNLYDIKECYKEILKRGECVALKELAVNGKDLIAFGIGPGKQIGEILERLLALVIEEPQLNTKELLLEKVHTWLNESSEL